jgi:hypothetical protein
LKTRYRRRTILAVAALSSVLAMAACSSSGKPATPRKTETAIAPDRVPVLVVQCFIDHHLIPASVLDAKNTVPPDDAATWLHNGKIVDNENFGSWYHDAGAGVLVHGKIIGEWVTEITASAKAWPTGTCGPIPRT